MIDDPADAERRDNLREPVDDAVDHGAHGAFDDRARDRSYQLWGVTHPRQLLSVMAGPIVCLGAVLLCLRRSDDTTDNRVVVVTLQFSAGCYRAVAVQFCWTVYPLLRYTHICHM